MNEEIALYELSGWFVTWNQKEIKNAFRTSQNKKSWMKFEFFWGCGNYFCLILPFCLLKLFINLYQILISLLYLLRWRYWLFCGFSVFFVLINLVSYFLSHFSRLWKIICMNPYPYKIIVQTLRHRATSASFDLQ